jgi:hypothetical protein
LQAILSGPMLLTDDAVTIIWIEYLRHSDARLRYSSHGQLYRTRLGGPDGEVLCDRVHNAISETCRVLMSLGILGTFETWKEDIHHACMQGEIETAAGLTVSEPDIRGRDANPGSYGGDHTPALRMPFLCIPLTRQRARTV